MPDTPQQDSKLLSKLIELRRAFHQEPELSHHESGTANKIMAELSRLGIKYQSGITGHGIVATLPGKRPGPYIALRGDMDALPIQEQTQLPFASKTNGVMHACGHDGHMTMLLGAAHLLLNRETLEHPVKLIFQPAEETGQGAKAMVDAGVLDNVAYIYGGHVDRHYPTGTLVVTEGCVNASSDRFEILITGKGAHGARPHESIDSIVIASLMVIAIQTIVSREVDPAHPSVVSVGIFQAGTASNVIAGTARLEGTIRSQDQAVREQLSQAIQRIAISLAELHGAEATVTVIPGTPPVINTPGQTALARKAAIQVVGAENVVPLRTANMGGEDFSYFLSQVPGAYIRYGTQLAGSESYPAHSDRFDFDEKALIIGANYLASVAALASRKLSQES